MTATVRHASYQKWSIFQGGGHRPRRQSEWSIEYSIGFHSSEMVNLSETWPADRITILHLI